MTDSDARTEAGIEHGIEHGDPIETETIAVVGMAGRFPKSPDVDAFWDNLARGVECVRFFSPEELEAAGVSQIVQKTPGFVPARAILTDPEMFDANFFGINPREAENTDPQHRLFLETAWEALEDAGYDPARYQGLIGVFAGADVNTYAVTNLLLGTEGLQTLIGNDKDYLATRVSYKLDLRGPSVSVQTACSTSLVAVHLACQSLITYQSDMALAGGVGVNFPQKGGYFYQEGGILSPDGHCRPFDAAAKGTVGGDGVGIVVLKRLSDAKRDRDRILAIIKGSAINNDGAMKVGFTAPSVEGQSEVIANAQMAAGVSPESIGYIETHGTGTQLGDPIELTALANVFRASTEKKGFCAIGSLKSNVGHMNSAAGVGSLIKAILSLVHGKIPPSLHYETPNPMFDFAESPFYVASRLIDWPAGKEPRRAGVSSFGIGGTNAHVVLEEAPAAEKRSSQRSYQVLPISARSHGALDEASKRLADKLETSQEVSLSDVAWTLQIGRRWFPHRRVVVAKDKASAIAALRSGSGQSVVREAKERSVAFLFPGQGSQYVNMGRGLYESEPVFRKAFDQCAELMRRPLGEDIRKTVFPAAGDDAKADDALAETRLTQPALFAIEYALGKLWESLGVNPRAMIGSSVGEYVAACLAGVFSLEDACLVIVERGRLLQEQPRGVMLAVPMTEEDAQKLPGVALAAINAPRSVVVAGTDDAITKVEAILAEKGISGKRLRTSHAFHSPLIEGMADPFRKVLSRVKLSAPQKPFLSNLTGTWITDAEAQNPEYWVKHCLQSVRLAAGLAELGKEEGTVLLEVGPGNTLVRLAETLGPGLADLPKVASARRKEVSIDDQAAFLEAVGALFAADVRVDFEALHGGAQGRVSLPTYPFERERFWIEPRARLEQVFAKKPFYGKIDDPKRWLYLPTWRRAANGKLGAGAEPTVEGTLVVFGREEGLSAKIAARLGRRTEDIVMVLPGHTYQKESATRYRIDPSDFASYEKLVSELVASGHAPRYVAHLWGTGGASDDSPETFARAQLFGFYSLAFLAKALGRAALPSPVLISAVAAGSCQVTGAEALRPERATILGASLAISQEYSKLVCRVLDVEEGASEAALESVAREVFSPVTRTLLAFRGDFRWIGDYEAVPPTDEAASAPRLRKHGTYVITGGLGGIGLILAGHLAKEYGANLVLTGRTGIPDRAEWEPWLKSHDEFNKISVRIRKLRELEALGAKVLTFSADAADERQMREVFREAVAKFGKIDGVIHAAGHVGQGLLTPLAELTWDRAELHFHSKAQGLYTIGKLLPRDVDFCLVTSSLASILGGIGGGAYAAANAFVDVFCQKKAALGEPFIAVNWDAWVPHEGSPEALGPLPAWARFAIEPDEGIAAFSRIVSLGGAAQVVVSTLDLSMRLDQLLRTERTEQASEAREAETRARHRRPAQNNEYVAPRTELETHLAEIWQALLGIDKVGIHDNFFRLGGDSLVAIQLGTRIRDAMGVDISVNQLFDEPTIAGLAGKLEALRAEKQKPEESSLLETLELVENMSDEEVARLLAEMEGAS